MYQLNRHSESVSIQLWNQVCIEIKQTLRKCKGLRGYLSTHMTLQYVCALLVKNPPRLCQSTFSADNSFLKFCRAYAQRGQRI